MLAAVLEKLNKIVVKEVPTPKLTSSYQMLVKVHSCAVCGSDIRIFRYGNPRVNHPQIIGHEIAGEVVEVGGAIKNFKVKDKVSIGADVPCGICQWCRRGLGNNCEINYAIGYQFPGGFAQYILLNETTMKYGPVRYLSSSLSYDEASLAEPLACCINGLEMTGLKLGETVLIIGAGPVGCLLGELARVMGAGKVILAQRSKRRLEIARKISSADFFISTEDEILAGRVKEITKGKGVDIVMVACANPVAQREALRVVAHRSRVNFFGGLPEGSPLISIDANLLHYKEVFLFGSHGSVPEQHLRALKLIETGSINVKPLITHTFPLSRIEEAFSAVEKREGLKAIIHPWGIK